MTVASERRHGRRESYQAPSPATTLAATETPVEEEAAPVESAVETVKTVETVPSVTGKSAAPPAPLTISRQRRLGLGAAPKAAYRTRSARALRLREEAAKEAAQKVTPFIAGEGTVDVAKMSAELGTREASKLLSQIGFKATPEELQSFLDQGALNKYVVPQEYYAVADPSGREVSSQEYEALKKGYAESNAKYESAKKKLEEYLGKRYVSTDYARSEKIKLGQLNSDRSKLLHQITQIEAGEKLAREVIDIPKMATDLGDAKTAELLSATGSYFTPKVVEIIRTGAGIATWTGRDPHQAGKEVPASSLSTTDIVLLAKLNGLTGGEAIDYARQLSAMKAREREGARADLAISEVSPELKGWLDEQTVGMNRVLAEAQAKYDAYAAKESGKDSWEWQQHKEYVRDFPEWSDQYKSAKSRIAAQNKRDAKAAAKMKAGKIEKAERIAITEITIPATEDEIAQADASTASGTVCPDRIATYKVKLKSGDVILVDALASGVSDPVGRSNATAKAKAAGYNVAWASRRMTGETVYAPSRMPTVDVGYYTVTNADGTVAKVHVPLGASDSIALEIADAYGLRGDPSSFQITGRETVKITAKRASEILTNAESSSGRLYGLMYMTVSPAFGADSAISPDSIPVRAGDAKTDVLFLSPGAANVFRKTKTYAQTGGTDIQRLNAAYQEYLNTPRIGVQGGWSMLVRSIRDALGNVLFHGFDTLSLERQTEIRNEIEAAASGEVVTSEDAGVDESEVASGIAAEPEEAEAPDASPQFIPPAGVTIPITETELQTINRTCASGACVGYVAKNFKVTLKNGDVIVVESLSQSLAEQKAENAGYDVVSVRSMFSWENPAEVATFKPTTSEPQAEDAAEPVSTMAEFEADLATRPRFLQNAYAVGGINEYNAAVEVYNDTIRSAERVYGGASDAPMSPPELISRVSSPEFQQQYAAVLQPAGMSNEEYAQIAPYIKPDNIDKVAAFQAGVPGNLFKEFALDNSSDEFRSKVESGELILLPYGDAISKEEFDKFPDVIQQTLLQDGLPMLAQQEEANEVANVAQGFLQNTWDALYLNSMGLAHSLKSAAVAEAMWWTELQGICRTDYVEGDLKPEYETVAKSKYGGIMFLIWGNKKDLTLTAEEAAEVNKKNATDIARWQKFYDDMQRAQLNWEAERPLLQPVFPEGALEAFQNLKDPKDIPLIISETIMATAPYTLATLGVSVVGFALGGPAGVALAAPIVFSVTLGSEGHQIYEDAIANGATRQQAGNLMNLYGSMSAAVETVGDSLFVGAFGAGAHLISRAFGGRVAGEVLREAAKRYTWKKLTSDLVIQFINQAGQEAVQQMVQNAAYRTVNEERPLFEGVADAFVGGLIGTAPFILVPSSGQAIRLAKGVRVEDIEGKLSQATFRPSDQKTIVDRVLQPLSQLVSSLGNAPVARKAAALYVRIGHLAMNYAANAAELAGVKESLTTLKGATQLVDQESITRLQAREQELVEAMTAEDKDLQSVSQDLVDLLSSLRSLDEGAREAIQEVPRNITGYLEELVTQTMQGRKQAAPTGRLAGITRQRAYPVSTFAKTVADAKVAVNAVRGVPKTTKLAITIAVNDMTYALARLGDAIQAAPSMARKTVLDAIANLEASVKKVYDLLKSLPEQSKVKLLQTVNEVSNFAASARFAASNVAQIVGNDLEYAFTSLGDAIKATPETVGKAGKAVAGDIETALTSVDIALKKAADMIDALPDTAARELSKALLNVSVTAKDIQTYVEMYSRIAAGEIAYKAGQAQEAIQAVPAEVSAAARRLGKTAKRRVGEGVLLTKMTAQVIANDIEYAVQTMIQTIRETPGRAAQAVAAALRAIRASLVSAKLTTVMSVKVAYNDLSYVAQQLIDAIKATPGVISDKAQAALNGVASAAGKLASQARHMATLTGDVRDLVVGELAYHTNRLLDAVGSVPRLADQAILDMAAAVDKRVLAVRKQLRGMPATVARYVDSVAALSQAVRAAIRNKIDFSILSMELVVYKLGEQARQIRDTVQSSPGRAKALVADAVLTSRVKVKQIPGNIEYRAKNYMSDLKRDILRAEENRLNRAYYSVGEDVMKAVKSEFNNVISGRKKLESKEYGSVVNGLADLMTALLRAVQGTEFSDEVKDVVDGVAEAIFSGDAAETEKAGTDLEGLLATVPGLSRDKKKVAPKMRTLQQLISDGGSYVRRNADDIVKSVQYKVILEDILAAETWGDTKVKLENFRDLLKDEQSRTQGKQQTRTKEDQALSDYLSQVNWEMGATKQERKEPPPQLSLREQHLQTLIQGRISKMMQPWGQGANQFRRDMQSSFPSVKEEAMKRFSEWMEGMYGRDWLDEITNEAEGQLMDTGEFAETGEAGEAIQGRWMPGPERVAGEGLAGPVAGGVLASPVDLSSVTSVPPELAVELREALKDPDIVVFGRVAENTWTGSPTIASDLDLISLSGNSMGVVNKLAEILSRGGYKVDVSGLKGAAMVKYWDTKLKRWIKLAEAQPEGKFVASTLEGPALEVEGIKVESPTSSFNKFSKSATTPEQLDRLARLKDALKDTREAGQELDVREVLAQAERILKENKDRPPDAPSPLSMEEREALSWAQVSEAAGGIMAWQKTLDEAVKRGEIPDPLTGDFGSTLDQKALKELMNRGKRATEYTAEAASMVIAALRSIGYNDSIVIGITERRLQELLSEFVERKRAQWAGEAVRGAEQTLKGEEIRPPKPTRVVVPRSQAFTRTETLKPGYGFDSVTGTYFKIVKTTLTQKAEDFITQIEASKQPMVRMSNAIRKMAKDNGLGILSAEDTWREVYQALLAKRSETSKIVVTKAEAVSVAQDLKPGYGFDAETGEFFKETTEEPGAEPTKRRKEEPPKPKPKPKPGAGVTRVATQERVEVKPETEELTETEKEALEKAKKEQATKEIPKEQLEEKQKREKAEKERLVELAEEAAKKEKERAKRKPYTRPGPAPGAAAVTRVVGKVMEAPELGAREMPDIAPTVMPSVETEVQVAPTIEIEPAIQVGAQIYPAIQTELYPAVQTETQVQPAVRTQTQVQPQTQLQPQLQPATQTQTQTQTQVQEQLAAQVQVAVKIPPWWKLPTVEALAEAYRRGIPILIWKQGKLKSGEVWKAVVDPQKQAGLLTVIGTDKLPVRPKKQASGPGSAAKTLQWLGEGPHHKGSADLGVVDVHWGRKGGELRFVGKGLGTDVGMRIPSPTVGISLETTPSTGSTAVKKSSKPPKSRVVAASPAGFVIPMGSLTWASGAITGEGVSRVQRVRWYYLPPPYTGDPIPLPGPPHGVSDPEGFDPVTTLQVVGRSRKAIPNTRIDLGFAEALIIHGIIEEVTPKMEPIKSTAVAQRPGMLVKPPTESEVAKQVGAAMEEPIVGEEVLESSEGLEEPIVAKTRVGLPKKAPHRKKISHYEYMTTLKGFDPYTFKGA